VGFSKMSVVPILRSMEPRMTACVQVVDLFAGAGGLSIGLIRAGCQLIHAYDNWQPAVETYRQNIDDHISSACISTDLDIPD